MRTRTASAPGRVNLIGEHTDYNGGVCLPFALPMATTANLRVRDDDVLTVRSAAFPGVASARIGALDPARREDLPGWARYVAGVVWAAREDHWSVPGLDVEIASDVPVGAGLSSSAALECSVALAIAALLERPVDASGRTALTRMCIRAETEYAGAPTGGMDQLVSLLGQPDHAVLVDFARAEPAVRMVPLPLADAGLVVLVTDTGTSHTLTDADGGYAARRADCQEAARLLGVPLLARAIAAAAENLPDGRLRARARHVIAECDRVRALVRAVEDRAWTEVGALMSASHRSLRDDFEVSTTTLDLAAATAVRSGALGARMTGGGFGGSTIALVAEARADAVRRAIDAAFSAHRLAAPTHRAVVPAGGAVVV